MRAEPGFFRGRRGRVRHPLPRCAGPTEQALLETEAVAENLVIVAGGGDAENVLKQMLHEYVSFALFSVGSVVDPGREASIKKEVGGMLARLRPQG